MNLETQDSATVVDLMDRRRSVRVPHCASFELCWIAREGGAPTPLKVVLQDLSATGMGVIHGEAIEVGQQFEVPLQCGGGSGAPALSLVCTVVRCEQLDDGLYNIGFIFNSSAAVIDAGSRQLTGQPAPPR